jgi:hypothetical protein
MGWRQRDMYRREGRSGHFVCIASNTKKIGDLTSTRFNMDRFQLGRLGWILLTRGYLMALTWILEVIEFEDRKP